MRQPDLAVIVPTYNNNKYLNLFLSSMEKNNSKQIPIHIHLDGCTDNSREVVFAYNNLDIKLSLSENRGMYSAINQAMRNVTANYFIIFNDDIFVAPNWDVNFRNACRSNRVLCPRMVEPIIGGSYPPTYDCGKTPDEFDAKKFEIYAESLSEDKLVLDTIGMWSFSTALFTTVNGLDESFDPFGCGGLEILYRIKVLFPEFDFRMVKNSIVYHFSTACKRENGMESRANTKAWTDKYSKYKIDIQDANNLLEGKRDLFDIERTMEFRQMCLTSGSYYV